MLRQLRVQDREPDDRELAALSKGPKRDAAMDTTIECWDNLDACRQKGFDIAGAIPWPEIIRWCRFHGYDREWAEILVEVISYLDAQRADRIASELAAAEARRKAKDKR